MEAGTLCRLVMEHGGRTVSNVPRELLRKRRISTVSPHPPPRSAVCDMRELMRLVARWAFSTRGINHQQILHYHELPVATYNKCGRVTSGGEKRRQISERAYKTLIQKHAFFDAVEVSSICIVYMYVLA